MPEAVGLIGLYLFYGLLHALTELGGAAVLQAAAVGLHALAEGGHGLMLAFDGVAGVGKGVEEQDHAPSGGYAVVNGAGVVAAQAPHHHVIHLCCEHCCISCFVVTSSLLALLRIHRAGPHPHGWNRQRP